MACSEASEAAKALTCASAYETDWSFTCFNSPMMSGVGFCLAFGTAGCCPPEVEGTG